ncbi:TetR/AcrR family transcriptional regulator [Rhodococcus erythropolis]|uniref:TetR/AcrR family transcriptional regulator n=1 Tax=Rhodococcus erythropolis TaxID=1833 RepID=UPI001BE99E5F|nr:helix-turn-helix domain-containing protein [Rhodococcus erythropolis]MBT2265775.1 TetR/AcrR family transcriptional regulator [Rhodococcus erythropolis]
MENPRATNDDLTARARIRNAAMDLYAQHGEDRVSLRAVATEAGVSLGLLQHTFKTKAGLREAVDELVANYFAQALAEVPNEGPPEQVSAARDSAVRQMLDANPPVVNYLRRALLEPDEISTGLLEVFIDLAQSEVGKLRQSGMASTARRESTQIVSVLVRLLGEYMLQPMVDAVWDRVATPGDTAKPTMSITVHG